jgi:gentisate 1,2-dioxygenase
MPDARFVDISGRPAADIDPWEPAVISGSEIAAEVGRLAAMPRPENGRREALVVHRRAAAPGLGLAPGIRVILSVLAPGERTAPRRHTSTAVGFCIDGGGTVVIDGRPIRFGRYDVWNHPSFRTYHYENDTDEIQVRLSYSNAPVLEGLGVHLVEDEPPVAEPVTSEADADDPRHQSPFGTFALNDAGAMLMPYETLINPPSVASPALHWPWDDVRAHLDKLDALGDDYVGRRLYLLYNPLTGRTNGTTPGCFATMTIRPPGITDRPHRHVSAAINYFFHGRGYSRIAGQRYEWQAGDLMFTAPGWAIHHHASGDDAVVYELTVQDQPFHLALESLLWQEDLGRPARLLGSEPGFATNR